MCRDPGELADTYRDLPDSISGMRDVVSGLIVHVALAEQYGIPSDVPLIRQTQPVGDRLQSIQAAFPGSLTAPRPPLRRTFGTCRDYALMLCSMLRDRSIPARVRCGFASYFGPNAYQDHWICEYWRPAETRWVQVDAQLDQLQIDDLRIGFDCADLPHGAFVTAAQAWRLARNNAIAANAFGHSGAAGLWFLRVNVHRDILSLTNRQMSAWDSWRDATDDSKILDASALAELDRLADAVVALEDGTDQFALLSEAAARNATPPWLA